MSLRYPVVALTLMACTGCLEDEDNVPVRQHQVAQVDLSQAHVLAVAPIAGSGGEALHDLLAHQLGRSHALVDPRDTYQMLNGMDLGSASAGLRAATARRLGADAIIVAQLLDSDVTQHFTWVQSQDGQRTTYTRHVELSLRVALQAMDAGGHSLGAITFDESYEVPTSVSVHEAPRNDEAFIESLFEPMEAMGMLYDGMARVSDAWDKACRPSVVRATVVLFTQRGEHRSAQAVHAARRGDWYLAAHWYSRALEIYSDRETTARLHYNRGVALLYAGYPRTAEHAFLDALDLQPSWRVQTLASDQLAVAQHTEGVQ